MTICARCDVCVYCTGRVDAALTNYPMRGCPELVDMRQIYVDRTGAE